MENFMIEIIFNFALVLCCFSSINGEIDSGIEKFFNDLFFEDLLKHRIKLKNDRKYFNYTHI